MAIKKPKNKAKEKSVAIKIPSKTVSSISDFIKALKKDHVNKELCWFRGHAVEKWKLLPHLARNNDWIKRERDLINKFKQNAALLLSLMPKDEWEWLTIMQHHGIPTRLLDWTESPLVALYFAVSDVKKHNTDGALWVLYPVNLNKKASVSPEYDKYIPSFDDSLLELYKPSAVRKESTSQMKPIAVIGPRNTKRMQVQQGVFTVIHRDNTPIEKIDDFSHVIKYIIPKRKKKEILAELSFLRIRRFELFPELESIGYILKGELP